MPGLIPEHILEQVRQSNDVVDVIGSCLPLKRKGAGFWALCPFHKEKTPSFHVNQQKQIWHCFGCGAGGNVFTFLMKYEGLDFISAVRRLAERAGIPLEFERAEGEPSRDQKEQLLKLHEQVAEFFHRNLIKEPASRIAREYLKRRRITLQTAKTWRLGYSPDSWDALIQWAKQKKLPPELLESAGLALRGERGLYDRFRGRLMFPICDEQGRVVAFSGRILTEAKDQPKYVNSPETPIFQKGKILFALDRAKRAILDERFAIVCEGQLDTISCHEAGLTNVVAPQGTALTEQHARILKRYADEVVLIFDPDAAGQNAAVRSAEPLLAAGLVIKIVVLPAGHDPDSFVKESGPEELRKLVTNAPGFFVYLLDRLSNLHDLKSDRGKLQAAAQVVEALSKIPNAILQSTYARQAAARLDIPESSLLHELGKFSARSRMRAFAAGAAEPAAPESTRPPALPAEEMLLQLMLGDDRIVETVDERLDRAWLTESDPAGLIQLILSLYTAGRWTGPDCLHSHIQDEQKSRALSEALLKPLPCLQPAIAARDCLSSLQRRWVEQRLRDLRKQLQQPKLDSSQMIKLQQQVLDLRRKLDHIARLSMQDGKLSPR